MTVFALTAALVLTPQDVQAGDEQQARLLKRVLTKTVSVSGKANRLSALFDRDARKTVRLSAITADTQSFSTNTFRRVVRGNTAGLKWTGYVTNERKHEVMTTSWTSELGPCTWVDNGLTVTIACTLRQQSDIDDVESAVSFVENSLRSLLQVRPVREDQIRHWLRPTDIPRTLWTGSFQRNLQLVEHTRADGTIMLLYPDVVEWHESMTVATDGSVLIVSFNLSEPQKHPLGGSPTPRKYVPFRFTKK